MYIFSFSSCISYSFIMNGTLIIWMIIAGIKGIYFLHLTILVLYHNILLFKIFFSWWLDFLVRKYVTCRYEIFCLILSSLYTFFPCMYRRWNTSEWWWRQWACPFSFALSELTSSVSSMLHVLMVSGDLSAFI